MIQDQALKVGPEPRIRRQRSWARMAKRLPGRLLSHLVLLAGSVAFALPFIWMLSTSLKADRQIFSWPPIWIPDPIVWGNYPAVFIYAPLHLYFFNTLLIATAQVFGAVLTCSLAAYGFSRLRAPGATRSSWSWSAR